MVLRGAEGDFWKVIRMQYVISALHYPWPDVAAAAAIVRDQLGLDGIEFSLASSWKRPHLTEADVAAVLAGDAVRGLALSGHIWENPAQLEPEEARRRLRYWVDLAADCGLTDLVVHGGHHEDQKTGLARMKAAMQAVLPRAEQVGVHINVENHYAYDYRNCHELYSTPEEFEDLFTLNSPNLGFCFDTGHGNMTKNTPELVRSLRGRLRYVHLADNMGVDDDHLMYGRGTFPWADFFDLLAEIGFDGIICVEFPVRDDLGPFRACLAEMRRRFG